MSFIIERFDPDKTYVDYKKFTCGNEIIDKFVSNSLKKQVKQKLSVAYCLLEEPSNRFVGFFTIASHSIPLSLLSSLNLGSLPKTIPCTRLIMLGVNQIDSGKGLGQALMNHALDILKLEAEKIGCFGMYLDSDPLAIRFYQRLGFHLLEGDISPIPSPMFIPLSAIV